jgi:hypothetical protein
MVIPENANAGGIEHQSAPERRTLIDPPGGEYTQNMSAGKNQDIPLERPKPRHDLIGPLGDLQDGLAAGAPVAEELPLRALSMDICKCPPFVMAVIPLDQLPVERCEAGKAGELTGSERPPERTREHVIELQVFESGAERASLLLTVRRECKIGKPGVLARDTPSGLSVPHEIDIASSCGTHETPVLAAEPRFMFPPFAVGTPPRAPHRLRRREAYFSQ